MPPMRADSMRVTDEPLRVALTPDPIVAAMTA